jgi:hypothetical protein
LYHNRFSFVLSQNSRVCFCLSARSCPECRQTSDYICPSRFWVDTEAEKSELLSSYKVNQNLKDCKYFLRGESECPFGNKCFYRHAIKDGVEVDVGPPPRRSRRQDENGEIEIVSRLLINDFLAERENREVVNEIRLKFVATNYIVRLAHFDVSKMAV